MKIFLSFIFIAFLNTSAHSTAQLPDRIIFNGKEYMLHTNPLESYFETHPEKRPKGGVHSTALWRGYLATFEIKDSQLYIKDIQIEITTLDTGDKKHYNITWKSVLNEVFPGQNIVKADWLTGLLVLPYGERVNYVHMGYGSTYEKYILLEIDKGRFNKAKYLDLKEYEKFKDRQFKVFKQTEDYKKLKADLQKDGMSSELLDGFLRNFVIQYSSKILVE
jgi:hypothetical protein